MLHRHAILPFRVDATEDSMTAFAPHGRLVWYELLTTDMKAAEAFYREVVGWTFSPFESSPYPYDAVSRPDGVHIGGVMNIPDGMQFPPHWEMYIAVSDFDEAVRQIEQRGGSGLSAGLEIPGVGKLRTMKDPQGAVFAIIQPAMPEARPESEAVDGDCAWHELYTADAAAAMTFYRDLFGWQDEEPYDMGQMGKYYMFGRTHRLGGMMNKPANLTEAPNSWGLYFRVADVAASAERITANGGQVLNGPMEVPGGASIVNALDPQGAAFSVHQAKP
jgi:predicted enzyme related to lactoylglutathione lyase